MGVGEGVVGVSTGASRRDECEKALRIIVWSTIGSVQLYKLGFVNRKKVLYGLPPCFMMRQGGKIERKYSVRNSD